MHESGSASRRGVRAPGALPSPHAGALLLPIAPLTFPHCLSSTTQDKNPDNKEAANAKFKEISEAYEVGPCDIGIQKPYAPNRTPGSEPGPYPHPGSQPLSRSQPR